MPWPHLFPTGPLGRRDAGAEEGVNYQGSRAVRACEDLIWMATVRYTRMRPLGRPTVFVECNLYLGPKRSCGGPAEG